jgi:thiamine biosynthesis lipoprotein
VLGLALLIAMLTISHHDPDYWTEHACRAMGATVHIVVGECPDALLGWASHELQRLESAWTRFRADSELSALNGSRGERVAVSDVMWSALERCDQLWRATEGAFDPTVLDALERWGYDRSFERVDRNDRSPVAAATAVERGWKQVSLDRGSQSVRLDAGVRIDLGGIGKGLAADRIAEGLVDRGARTACVSMGGDIRVAGASPANGWAVPVEDPFEPGSAHRTCEVSHGALAMSTTLIRRWRRGGLEVHHIIDPASDQPSRSGVVAAVVAAGETWWAEGLAKAAIVLGPTAGVSLLRRAGVSGWVTTADGETIPVDGARGLDR